MKTLAAKIDVDAPPDRVWEVLTDFPRYPEWNPFMFSVEGTAEAGAHLRIGMQRRGGMVLRFGARVVVADPPRELAWTGEGLRGHWPGLVRGDRRVVIDLLASGGSRVEMLTTFTGAAGAADGLARALPRGVRRDGGGVEGPRRAEPGTTLAAQAVRAEAVRGAAAPL